MALLPVLFFLVALFYASVGFGGGSSYLAILSLFQDDVNSLRATALLCNVVVVSGNLIRFQRAKLVPWQKALPLVLASVPLAFLGARMRLSDKSFFIVLGVLLVLAGLAVFFRKKVNTESPILKTDRKTMLTASLIGSGIGFVSGLVGIGGGIFLSPFLHLRRWDLPKKIAATASLFIFANSVAGLLGLISRSDFQFNWAESLPLVLAVFVGGQIGAWLSAEKFSQNIVRIGTAVLTIYVGLGLLWKWLA